MSKVIFVMGEICAGKNTFLENNIKGNFLSIDLGQLVREKFATQERIFDNTLDNYFINRIAEMWMEDDYEFAVILGLRQVNLCKKIADLFSEVEYNYLVCPRKILKQRYLNRGAKKDADLDFEKAIEGDNWLGMKDLQNYLLTEVQCNFIKSY